MLFNGESCESIQGAKLPTTRQILQYSLSLLNCSIYDLIKQAVKEVFVFWHMAGIKTIYNKVQKKSSKVFGKCGCS